MRRALDQLRFAMMMLTRLPVGQLSDPVPSLAQSAWAFPLVGAVTGSLGWAVLVALSQIGLSAMLAALLALAAMIWVTGALHEDGLADVADGLGGGRDREACLEIMRDSRIGSYGVVALVLVLGLKATALAELLSQDSAALWASVVFVAIASRALMLAVLILLPPARPDGLGHTAAGPAPLALLPGVAVLVASGGLIGVAGIAVVLVMALAAIAMAGLAHRRINGQTGDVLGGVQNLSETIGLVAVATLFVG